MSPSIPLHPFLRPWYRLAREGDRLLLGYGTTAVSFEGAAATRLLPPLLALLDGTRTVRQIVHELGDAVAPAVEHALRLLAEHGVLGDGPLGAGDDPSPVRETLAFFEATASVRAGAALAERRVAVAGGRRAREVARLLRSSGLLHVELRELAGAALADCELAVVAPDPPELPALPAVNAAALETGIPWLQLLPYDGAFAAAGPLFVPGETCCYDCFRLRRCAHVPFGEEFWALDAVPAAYPSPPALDALLAALAAELALRWLADPSPYLPGALYAVELESGASVSRHDVFRVPRCPSCSPAARLAAPQPWFEPAAAVAA